MRIVFALIVTLLLSACGTLPPGQVTAGSTYQYPTVRADEQATMADRFFDVRTGYIVPESPLVEGIRIACSKGVRVSVLLYVGAAQSARALYGTCAAIYLSGSPDVRDQGMVSVVDHRLLSMNGNPIAVKGKGPERELQFQQQQKAYARRIQ